MAFKMLAPATAEPAAPSAPILRSSAGDPAGFDRAQPALEQILSASGQPLDQAAREWAEPRFGYDFSRVRVHSDAASAAAAVALGARAFTAGEHIVFGKGAAPGSPSNRWLLAHELAHVTQVYTGRLRAEAASGLSSPGDPLEREAEHAARRSLAAPDAAAVPPVLKRAPAVASKAPAIQRYIDWDAEERRRQHRENPLAGSNDAEAERRRSLDSQRQLLGTDAEDESRLGREKKIEADAGIDKAVAGQKMLPIPNVNGQSFSVAVPGEGGNAGKVEFRFAKALVGERDPTGNKALRGLYVKLSASLSGRNCDQLQLLQVMRLDRKRQGLAGAVDQHPFLDKGDRRKLSGLDDPGQKNKSPGWMLDTPPGVRERYVTSLNRPGKPGGAPGWSTADSGSAGDAKAATMWDNPALPAVEAEEDPQMMFRDIGMEFYTCAVCIRNGQAEPLASVHWGYYIDGNGAVAADPATPQAMPGAPQEVRDAQARFDALMQEGKDRNAAPGKPSAANAQPLNTRPMP